MTHSTPLSKENTHDDLAKNKFIAELILSNIKTLPHDRVYLTEDLIGEDGWESLDTGVRINIGKAVSKLVERKLLPITAAGKKTNNKRIYRLDEQIKP